MASVLLEIFAQVCPAAANPHHDAFAVFAHAADEQLDRRLAIRPGEVIQLDFLVASLLVTGPGVTIVCWCESERGCSGSGGHVGDR